uniref:Ovule protein n=1 Tax=Acrobeloides nanus TaxID=290746 RepID=A0A914DRL6_9BILA
MHRASYEFCHDLSHNLTVFVYKCMLAITFVKKNMTVWKSCFHSFGIRQWNPTITCAIIKEGFFGVGQQIFFNF